MYRKITSYFVLKDDAAFPQWRRKEKREKCEEMKALRSEIDQELDPTGQMVIHSQRVVMMMMVWMRSSDGDNN